MNKTIRKISAIKKVRETLKALKKYNINKKDLLKVTQPVYKSEPLIFNELHKIAKDLKIKTYNIISTSERKENGIFDVEIDIVYNFRIEIVENKNNKILELSNIPIKIKIAVIPELEIGNITKKGNYNTSLLFIKMLQRAANHFFYTENKDKISKF